MGSESEPPMPKSLSRPNNESKRKVFSVTIDYKNGKYVHEEIMLSHISATYLYHYKSVAESLYIHLKVYHGPYFRAFEWH